MPYLGTQPNDVKKNTGLYTPSEILQLEKDGNWGGSLELIQSQTISGNVAQVDFTDIKENIYDVHLLEIINARSDSDDKDFSLRVSVGGTFDVGANYHRALFSISADGGTEESRVTTSSQMDITLHTGNATNEKANSYIYIYNAGNSSTFTYNNISTKNQMQLDLSGLLSMKTGFPIVASGDIEIEIILEDSNRVLEQKQDLICSGEDFTTAGDGSLTGGKITLAPSHVGGANIYRGNNWTTTSSPYANGNVVKLTGKTNGVDFTLFTKVNGNTTTNAGSGKIEVPLDCPATFFNNAENITHLQVEALFNVNDPATPSTAPVYKTTESYVYEVSNVEYI